VTDEPVASRGSSEAENPGQQLARLLDGYLVTQLLYVAARLGIADVLATGPRSADGIASAVGAEPRPLLRVLRGLAAEGVLAETGAAEFALTPMGAGLARLRGAALVRGQLYYQAAAGLLTAVQTGGTPFEREFGATFFDHLGRHPDDEAAFHASMAGRDEDEARAVVEAYDVSHLRTIVDVGGGRGVLLARLLAAAPEATGTVVDRAAVIPSAETYLAAAELAGRSSCVVGDFFASVPAGADVYVLSRVLHDWDDPDAARILATCRAAVRPDSVLLVVDAVLPERASERPAAIRMDLHMLVLLGARERTLAELRVLLEGAGFRLGRVAPTASPTGLAVVEALPA
jgi:SAM-dependent methyltransferase